MQSEFKSRRPDLKKFQKKVEDFVCEKCGFAVSGNGYTNHCPKCLWSKHVDVNPGDRASECGGMMEPISIENKNSEMRIQHECKRCGFKKYNKVQRDDSTEEIIKLSSTN